jgi:hypothetical protein
MSIIAYDESIAINRQLNIVVFSFITLGLLYVLAKDAPS